MSPPKVKRLGPKVLSDLEAKNRQLIEAGLKPVLVKVRRCLSCAGWFESLGNRTCGCLERH